LVELGRLEAKILFLSCEPLLGALNLQPWIEAAKRDEFRLPHWLIAGGESGAHARPPHPEWFTSLRDQCLDAGIKFHFKQWGNWRPVTPRQLNGYQAKTLFLSSGDKIIIANMGKSKAGRLLEGKTWSSFPRSPAKHAFRNP
jgi:protein gp37